MELFGALCHLSYVVVSAVLGVRLLRRGRADGGVPELWLGVALLGMGGFGYLAMLIPAAIGPDVQTAPLLTLSAIGRLMMDGGMLAMLGFTFAVFRPAGRWARAVAAGLAVLTCGGVAGMFAAGDWWGKDVHSTAYWVEVVGAQGVLGWAALEAWIFRRQLVRRRALGLGEPEVANRALLWAGFGAAQFTLMVLVTLATVLYDATGRIFVGLDAAIATCGLASGLCLWLAFWPPEAYRRWAASPAVADPAS